MKQLKAKPNPGFQAARCRRAAEKASSRFLRGELAASKRMAKAALKNWTRVVRDLQRELKEAKADALDSLNNQAEAISELQARAVPEGWEFVTIAKWSPKKGPVAVASSVVKRNYVEEIWTWRVESRNGKYLRTGEAKSFNEAVQQAEKAGKKVKR